MSATAFLDYLARDRNFSPHTITTYRSILRRIPDIEEVGRDEIEAWYATTRHLAPTTRAVHLAAVRSYCKWAARFGHRDNDPTIRLDSPKLATTQPHPVSRVELHAILDTAALDVRRAVALCAYSGMRVSEAAALDWCDVDEETRRIHIRHGKGAKDRTIGLPPLLLDEIRPRVAGNVVMAGGTPRSANALQMAINRTMRTAGVDNTSHGLRGRFATIALTSVNLLAVSRALGHAATTTTARYAATADTDLDIIAEAVTRGM